MTDSPAPDSRDPLRSNRREFGLGVLASVAVVGAAGAATDDLHPFGDEFPNLDSLAVGEWWKKPRRRGRTPRPDGRAARSGGRVRAVHDDHGVLKMSAQLFRSGRTSRARPGWRCSATGPWIER